MRVVARSAPAALAAVKEWLSSRPLRIQNTTTARTPPMANGMRQPQSSSAAVGKLCCRTMSTASASNWPPIRVTNWKDDQNPRRALLAISDI